MDHRAKTQETAPSAESQRPFLLTPGPTGCVHAPLDPRDSRGVNSSARGAPRHPITPPPLTG